jgi:hypothetical protein
MCEKLIGQVVDQQERERQVDFLVGRWACGLTYVLLVVVHLDEVSVIVSESCFGQVYRLDKEIEAIQNTRSAHSTVSPYFVKMYIFY